MQVYRQDSIHGIHKVVLLIESITDQTKFKEAEKQLNEMLSSIVELLSEAYHRMINLNMIEGLALEQKEFLSSFLYLKHQFEENPDLMPIYYEASGSVYQTHFPTRFGKPGVYWADFEHTPNNGEQTDAAPRDCYDIYLKCRDVRSSLIRLEDLISVFIAKNDNETTGEIDIGILTY